MVIMHQDLVGNLPISLAELTEFKDVLKIDKFITDVMYAAMDLKRETRRRTMCSLFAVTATAAAWPTHTPHSITAVALNA